MISVGYEILEGSKLRGKNRYYNVRCRFCKKQYALTRHDIRKNKYGCYTCSRTKHGTTIGGKRTRVYSIWKGMRRRCYKKSDQSYKYYGAKGVTISKEWESFVTFRDDMGPMPSLKHSIDRIDPYGNYEKKNCRWATALQQAHNKRRDKERGE